ncbi:hypothetical protein CWB80_19420 [Pseudoalteromonas sp. S1650]|nr:hypothetical protein CWB80_19420 [Pseudoalteromonas sp. S1650]
MATIEYHQQAVDLFSPFNHEWCTYYLNSGFIKDHYWAESIPTLEEINTLIERINRNQTAIKNLPFNKDITSRTTNLSNRSTEIYKSYLSLYSKLQKKSSELIKQEQVYSELIKTQTKEYLANTPNSSLAKELNRLGYMDQIFTFGFMGSPYKSTYASLTCLETLYEDVEILKEDKALKITYGKKGFLSITPQYTIKIVLMQNVIPQFTIISLEKHDLSVQTNMDKWLFFFSQLHTCQQELNIDLEQEK